jgi:putative transposase
MLTKNAILEYMNGDEIYRERVLWLDSKNVITMPMGINKWPVIKERVAIEEEIEEQSIRIATVIDSVLAVEAEIPKNHKEKREKYMKFINVIMAPSNIPRVYIDAVFRGRVIKEYIQETTNMSSKNNHGEKELVSQKSTAYKKLRRYWEGGSVPNCLLPDYRNNTGPKEVTDPNAPKRGRPRKETEITGEPLGINVTKPVARDLIKGARLFYTTGRSFHDAYLDTLKRFFTAVDSQGNVTELPENQRPSEDQMRYWYYKRFDVRNRAISKNGTIDFNLRRRAVLGSALQTTFGPGARFEIDATPSDTLVVSRFNRSIIIGRPVIYAVIDVFSHMIVGIYVGFEGPSWLGAMMALYNAGINKVNFCACYGIEISSEDWPCEHIPELLVFDRGEGEGHGPENLVRTLNVDVQILPPYRADWKATVERVFGILHSKYVPWTPGKVVKDYYSRRGMPDSRLEAVLDIEEFTKILIGCVLDHNNEDLLNYYRRNEKMIADDLVPYPINIWNWGIRNSSSELRVVSEDTLRYSLMPTKTAVITDRGIKFQGNYYSCKLAEDEGWFILARERGRVSITVSYDPRNLDSIYFLHKDKRQDEEDSGDKNKATKKVIRCDLLEKDARCKNKTLEEILVLGEMETLIRSMAKHKNVAPAVRRIATTEEIIIGAIRKTEADINKYGIVGRKRLIDSKTWRALDKAYERIGHVFRIGENVHRQKAQFSGQDDQYLQVPELTDNDC